MAKDSKTTKATKANAKTKPKAKPALFAEGAVITQWQDPTPKVPTTHFAKPSIRHLDNLQMRYICSTFEHIKADIELLTEVRKINDTDYEDIIEGNVSDGLDSLINYLMNTKVLIVNE